MAGKAQGIKRDPNAAARAWQAFDLICAGYTYAEAAHIAGYASSGACWNAVQREMGRVAVEKTDNLRKMHVRRLQRLRKVFMPKAEAGDGWSADRVLRFDEREAALMGLDAVRDELLAAGEPQVKLIRRGGQADAANAAS